MKYFAGLKMIFVRKEYQMVFNLGRILTDGVKTNMKPFPTKFTQEQRKK